MQHELTFLHKYEHTSQQSVVVKVTLLLGAGYKRASNLASSNNVIIIKKIKTTQLQVNYSEQQVMLSESPRAGSRGISYSD